MDNEIYLAHADRADDCGSSHDYRGQQAAEREAVKHRDLYIACPHCLYFDDDFQEIVYPGKLCPNCHQAHIRLFDKYNFYRWIVIQFLKTNL